MRFIPLSFHSIKSDRKINAPGLKRILGVDQLRYVFAIWVFFKHSGAPPLFTGHAQKAIYYNIDKLYEWCINGQAAVIGFFIISGLVIHYPNIRREKLNLKSFYVGRLLRLSVPLVAVLIIAKLINFPHANGISRAVPIWTLYCEAAYYLIYPAVLPIIKKGYLIHLIVLATLVSFVANVFWTSIRTENFQEIGYEEFFFWHATLLAFPCWLLGVLIAERISINEVIEKEKRKGGSLIGFRLGAIALSLITFPLWRIGNYHHFNNTYFLGFLFSSQFTLILFSFYAFFWIQKEVIFYNFRGNTPNDILERSGSASYSLYLVHLLVIYFFDKISSAYFPGYLFHWLSLFFLLHVITYLFYRIIELPSHRLSKYGASLFKNSMIVPKNVERNE